MPLKKGGLASLSGMIDSDDDVDIMPSPSSNQENEPVSKPTKALLVTGAKPRGRPPGKAPAAAKPKSAAPKRAPLKEHANEQQPSDVEDGDELGGANRNHHQSTMQESEPEVAPKKRGRPPGKAKAIPPVAKAAVMKAKATAKDGEFEYTPTRTETSKISKEKKGQNHSGEEEDDNTMLSIEEDDVQATKAKKASHSRQMTEPTKARSHSRRAGSPSGDERGGDPSLRRKLGEMTRKFEALESRYRNLKEIGIVEAESNFDRLKKQSEQRTKAANDLIESLRNELEAQRSLSQEARDQNSSLAAAETRVTELTASLNAARKENQTLQAKLARNGAESSARGAKVSAARPGAASNSELQNLQLKEDLYSDLTGLIIRSVTKQDNAATFDCIQTGCNGTLHFKLAVTPEDSAASYEDSEFSYDPRLDRNRDQELIDIMPDYLREEITFSRANAAKFYSRIADTVTKRNVED